MDWQLSICGFIVGALIGLTGMGGGTIMTPLMILIFHVHAALAVGTDLVYSSITKLFGAGQHLRQRTVDRAVLIRLVIGSVPGAVIGSLTVAWMAAHLETSTLNLWVGRALGVVYILAIVAMVWRYFIQRGRFARASAVTAPSPVAATSVPAPMPTRKLVLLGLFAGFVVGMTSVGSGSIYIAMLGIIYPMAGAKMVGTDIVQGFIVTGVAGVTHLLFGNVDLWLVASLLVGSIPGILIGSRLSLRIPDIAVRACLIMMLGWSSFALLAK